MRRILSSLLIAGILIGNAGETWQEKFSLAYKHLRGSNSAAFLDALEKESGAKLSRYDRSFLSTTFSRALSDERPEIPELNFSSSPMQIKYGAALAQLELRRGADGEPNEWKLNGIVLNTASGESIETVAKQAQGILNPAKTGWLDFILPQAHADTTGTVIAVIVAAAVIGAVVYFANKTTKSATRAIERVGNSAGKAAEKVGDSASRAIDKASDSAGKLLDKVTDKVDSH